MHTVTAHKWAGGRETSKYTTRYLPSTNTKPEPNCPDFSNHVTDAQVQSKDARASDDKRPSCMLTTDHNLLLQLPSLLPQAEPR